MKHPVLAWCAMGLAIAALASPASAATRNHDAWRNPSGSVQVQAHPCGEAICGTVIWASAKARADVANAGSGELVGAQLFKDFVQDGEDRVRGEVFVPDIRRTFSGTVTLVNPDTARARGCLVGRVGCRSQDWTRIPRDQLAPEARAAAERLAPRP